MGQLIPLIVQLIGGAVGGNAVGALMKNAELKAMLRTILGIVGGVCGGQIAQYAGILQNILGDAASTGGMVAGNAGASAIGGALLTLVVGLIKQSMNKSKA